MLKNIPQSKMGHFYPLCRLRLNLSTSTLFPFFLRISLVEPGPVGTAFVSNLSRVDTSTADQKSLQLLQAFVSYTGRKLTVSSVSQKSEEIAEVVKEILLSAKPHFRYITNKKVSVAEINAKLVDPTGDKLQDVIDKQNFFGMKSEWQKQTFFAAFSESFDFELEALNWLTLWLIKNDIVVSQQTSRKEKRQTYKQIEIQSNKTEKAK